MSRLLIPFDSVGVAWLAVLAVAFSAGFVYPAVLIGRAPLAPDALFFSFLIGMTFVFIAAPVAALVGFAIGGLLFRAVLVRGYQSRVAYLSAGLLLSFVAAALVGLAHFRWGFLGSYDFRYSLFTIGISGPIAGWVIWKHAQTIKESSNPRLERP